MSQDYRRKIDEQVASNFQDAPAAFDAESANHWGRRIEKYLCHWRPESKDAAILEIGWGGGKLLHFFKERGYQRLTCVDCCDEQINLSRQVTGDVVHADGLAFLENAVREGRHDDLIAGFDH